MPLIDKEIRQRLGEVLIGADESQIQNICYDLRTAHFFSKSARSMDRCELMPGESIFVESVEKIKLPDDMLARVSLRNSRIRQGLALEAPVYQPGHETKIYFRVSNISKSKITLQSGDGIASLFFEQLSGSVQKPYCGTFQEEDKFKGMGNYESAYRNAMEDLEEKADELRHIEKSMYGNVINLMVIFIGIFSLININVQMAAADAIDAGKFLMFNLTTVGSVAFLSALICGVAEKHRRETPDEEKHRFLRWAGRNFRWLIAVVCFVAAILLYICGGTN